MRAAAVGVLITMLLLTGGCGDEDEGAAPAPTTDRTYATVPEDPARSDAQCVESWNAFMRIGDAGQRSDLDLFLGLVERGFAEAVVAFQQSRCEMLVPVGPRRAVLFFAPDGRGPWIAGPPDLSGFDLEDLPEPNVRADRDGILSLTR